MKHNRRHTVALSVRLLPEEAEMLHNISALRRRTLADTIRQLIYEEANRPEMAGRRSKRGLEP